MAKFKPGQSGNPEGRPKGAKDKANKEIRQKISDFIEANIDKIQSDINELEPEKRIRYFIQLLEYSIPKMRAIEADITETESLTDTERNEIIKRMKQKYLYNTKNKKNE